MNPLVMAMNKSFQILQEMKRTIKIEIHAEVEEMNNFSLNSEKIARILVASDIIPEFHIYIRRNGVGQFLFKIQFINIERVRLISCKVLALGISRSLYECGQYTEQEIFKAWCEFPLNFELFMADTLTMKCQVSYFELDSQMSTTFVGRPFLPSLRTSPCVENSSLSGKEKEHQKPPSTLADDLISLYKERTLCDTTLRTESETFPAHKTVLSARSPVFKKMFTSEMKEKASAFVDILDINADTLRKLLMFIYTDTVPDMKWQNAMELYFAADKYQIDSLKLKCSSFLKSNLQTSNCCDLLLLSDIHQDADLKQFVQDYIIKREQEIFRSYEWKKFMANHVQLAADTMYFKYTRK